MLCPAHNWTKFNFMFLYTDILGNAYVSLFFTCGQNPQLSQQALSAYAQSVSTHTKQAHTLNCTVKTNQHRLHHLYKFFTPLPPFVGESGQSCLLLPGAAFQPSHSVPVWGDVWVCARRLQPSGGARPRLGGASGEREAAAGVSGESHRTPTEQGSRMCCSFTHLLQKSCYLLWHTYDQLLSTIDNLQHWISTYMGNINQWSFAVFWF